MRKLLKPIQWNVLENILITEPSRERDKEKLREWYNDTPDETVDAAVLEGKASGIMHKLMLDSIEHLLAQYVKKQFYKK